jgi:hypothetical protein
LVKDARLRQNPKSLEVADEVLSADALSAKFFQGGWRQVIPQHPLPDRTMVAREVALT